MKKISLPISILLLVMFFFYFMVGCSTGIPADTTTVDADTVPTLVWWNIGTVPEDLQQGMKHINEYLEKKIGVRIDLKIAGWNEWPTMWQEIINANVSFDIMYINNEKYNQYVGMGVYADITDLVQRITPTLWKFIPEKVWSGTSIGGKIYSVPTYKDSSITQYWAFDNQYVQKYDIAIDDIKDMHDLDKVFRTLKSGEGDSFHPLMMNQESRFNGFFNGYYDQLTVGLEPLGVRLDDEDRRVVSVLEQPEIMDRLRLLHQWYQSGIINPDAPHLQKDLRGQPFLSAQAFPGAEKQWNVTFGVDDYVMTNPITGPYYTTDSIQGSMNAISAASLYKEEALRFLELINTDHKLRDMFAFGIEGTHFEYVNEERTVIHKLTDTWTLPAYTQASFFEMSTQDDAPPDQWEQVKRLNNRAESSVCLGFAMDITDTATEVANCKAVWDKYKFELLTGASNPDEKVQECLDELRANGFDTIMTEAQKQLHAFFVGNNE